MRNPTWATREDIAEIYDSMADKAADSAANGGKPGDFNHVVSELKREEDLRQQAKDYRDIERLGRAQGDRVA